MKGFNLGVLAAWRWARKDSDHGAAYAAGPRVLFFGDREMFGKSGPDDSPTSH
jgi:hypothetical protein